MGASLLTIATQFMVISIIVAFIILFIGIGVLVLLHIYIVGKAFRRGLNTISQGEELKNEGHNGLSPDDLEKLPCYDFDGGEKDCAVCLESFRNGEKCRLLPTCRHSFHAQCVDYWLVKTPICPICRTRACEEEGGEKRLEDGPVVFGFQGEGKCCLITCFESPVSVMLFSDSKMLIKVRRTFQNCLVLESLSLENVMEDDDNESSAVEVNSIPQRGRFDELDGEKDRKEMYNLDLSFL